MYKHYKNGFYVSDKGKVARIRNNKRVNVDVYTNNKGYKYFILFNTSDKQKVYIHRAVAQLFISQPSKDKYIVDHVDRNNQNNNVDNLRWVNHSENMINRSSWKGETK